MKKLTLQDIKKHFSYCIDEGLAIGEQEEILLHSLYKKAEKMEEQQKEIESWKELHGSLSKRATHLSKENVRLKEVLEFYGMRHNYAYSALEDNIPKVNLDCGEKARKTLKELQEGTGWIY